jgi:hypothetical protein
MHEMGYYSAIFFPKGEKNVVNGNLPEIGKIWVACDLLYVICSGFLENLLCLCSYDPRHM